MKKYRQFFSFTLFIVLLEVAGTLVITSPVFWEATIHHFRKLSTALIALWLCGTVYLLIKKGRLPKILSRLLVVCNGVLAGVTAGFSLLCVLAFTHSYQGDFSVRTNLFEDKNVMIFVPHQDDDINLMGGLIEQYTGSGSEVSVVFTTNGDRYAESEIRAKEAVRVLTTLGVEKANIYYLGFGDQWEPHNNGDAEIGHIYNSSDPDRVWTSLYGATATYSTQSIPCYLELPYTRNNYLYSIQSIIEEKKPDTFFSVDFDSHIDHKAADLFFEEALCSVLTRYPDYHPTVYKGFCYGTAWKAVDDYFDSLNLLSTQKPDPSTWSGSAYGYLWEERARFPVSETNLNPVLSNNSVSHSMVQYRSQDAAAQVPMVLNGDKVFWERRTDSLLYGAQIFVVDRKTDLLNDFKLKEFAAIADEDCKNSGFEALGGKKVTVQTADTVAINTLYLYDNPDAAANILAGFVAFSDGSEIPFSELQKDGSATVLSFPEKQVEWLEIVVTETDSEEAGLSEIEAFYDGPSVQAEDSTCLMAVDEADNLVYDYLPQQCQSSDLPAP